MNIINLREKTEDINTLARWHQDEWGYLNPNGNLQKRLDKMQMFLQTKFIPSMYIATDNQLLGSAACVEHDMDNRLDLSPWLASVYVSKTFRTQGIGSKLVQHVMDQARAHKIDTLYLFTPDQESFYARLGWQVLEETIYHGHAVTIMSVALNQKD